MYPLEKYNYLTYDQTNKDGTTSKVVVALSTYKGKVIKGVAKCSESDEYSFEYGKRLAAARCDAKICRKRCFDTVKKAGVISRKLDDLHHYYEKVSIKCIEDATESVKAEMRLNRIRQELN